MRKAARGKAVRLLARLVYVWQLATPRYKATPVWDAAVAALAVEPALGNWRTMGVAVVLEPQPVAGQTIAAADSARPIQVCFSGDQAAFEAAYLALVAGKLKQNGRSPADSE
jgi:inosine-uridine nucleoside N-ribohydrolase